MRRALKTASAFFHHEAAGGIVLLIAAILALVVKNSAFGGVYDAALEFKVGPKLIGLNKPLLLWINDALMAVFFLLVGLEIKRELVVGELSSIGRAMLPGFAAAGGMIAPALIYIAVNVNDPSAIRGWAIPAATDIAFAVGVLALLGTAVPVSVKIFLLALAILDDLGAILIIAVFYTEHLNLFMLGLAVVGCGVLLALNRREVPSFWPYGIVGAFVWLCVLKSGLHATIAGVVVALFIPIDAGSKSAGDLGLLERVEEGLHNWVKFGILPIFAFANAGVSLVGLSPGDLLRGVPLGIMLGLVIGKPLGIFTFTWAAVKSGLAPRPKGATWMQILGASMLGGIGFTMSLFIGMLAFSDPVRAAELRLGVLAGSLISAVAGYALLKATSSRPQPSPPG